MAQSSFSAILAYHSLDDTGSVLSTSPRVFAEQMRVLSELGVDVVSIGELQERMIRGDAVKPMIAISFDDGFRNVYECGLSILQRYAFPATVFLVTDYCGRDNSWPSQPPRIMRQPLLGWREIQEMSRDGISFGSHTRTHPDLRKLSIQQAEEELVDSKKAIADVTGCSVDTLAYPYGAYDAALRNLARQHFRLACSTRLGFVKRDSDPFALERIEMYYFQSPLLFRHLFSPTGEAYLGVRKQLRRIRRAL
jgi:peptidoglycan/xylan/chitin deacetylase (PgdA/CDA1 family)